MIEAGKTFKKWGPTVTHFIECNVGYNCRNYDKGSYLKSWFRDRDRKRVASSFIVIAVVRRPPTIQADIDIFTSFNWKHSFVLSWKLLRNSTLQRRVGNEHSRVTCSSQIVTTSQTCFVMFLWFLDVTNASECDAWSNWFFGLWCDVIK